MRSPVIIKGRAIALVSQYTRFDPAKPEETPAARFALIEEENAGDGLASWVRDGYRHVGSAEITITLMSVEEIAVKSIESLRAAKEKVRADAQAESLRLDREIQSLLAISHEG